MSQPFTQSEIEDLGRLAKSGDPDARTEYYARLEAKGYEYGQLAGGVVNDEYPSGRIANSHLAYQAENTYGKTLCSKQAEEISTELMAADFEARLALFREGKTDLSLNNREINEYHTQVFTDNDLGAGAWTAHTPLEMAERYPDHPGLAFMGFEGGTSEEAREFMWEYMKETGDNSVSYEVFGMMNSGMAIPNPSDPASNYSDTQKFLMFMESVANEDEQAAECMGDFYAASAENAPYVVMGFGSPFCATTSSHVRKLDRLDRNMNAPKPSPLVLDLDGDGIELTALDGSSTYFDLNINGFAELTGWVSPDDALLALDVNCINVNRMNTRAINLNAANDTQSPSIKIPA